MKWGELLVVKQQIKDIKRLKDYHQSKEKAIKLITQPLQKITPKPVSRPLYVHKKLLLTNTREQKKLEQKIDLLQKGHRLQLKQIDLKIKFNKQRRSFSPPQIGSASPSPPFKRDSDGKCETTPLLTESRQTSNSRVQRVNSSLRRVMKKQMGGAVAINTLLSPPPQSLKSEESQSPGMLQTQMDSISSSSDETDTLLELINKERMRNQAFYGQKYEIEGDTSPPPMYQVLNQKLRESRNNIDQELSIFNNSEGGRSGLSKHRLKRFNTFRQPSQNQYLKPPPFSPFKPQQKIFLTSPDYNHEEQHRVSELPPLLQYSITQESSAKKRQFDQARKEIKIRVEEPGKPSQLLKFHSSKRRNSVATAKSMETIKSIMERCDVLQEANKVLYQQKGALEKSHEYFSQLKGILPRALL